MGDPKKPRKNYKTPRNLWQIDQLAKDLNIMGIYGLRNKHELWKAETELSRIRKQARMLLAEPIEKRMESESKLLNSLSRKNIVSSGALLDDVLSLTVENLLERRLQSVVHRKGIVPTIQMARQAVVHGHIKIKNRVMNRPGYTVEADEESTVQLSEGYNGGANKTETVKA